MPLYPVHCTRCEIQYDVHQSMEERGAGVPYPPCDTCHGPVQRVVTAPHLVGMDTAFFKSWWSDNLSPGSDPVYIDSRSTWKQRMDAMGVRPQEYVHNPAMERAKVHREIEARQTDAIGRAVDATLAMGPEAVTRAAQEIRHKGDME